MTKVNKSGKLHLYNLKMVYLKKFKSFVFIQAISSWLEGIIALSLIALCLEFFPFYFKTRYCSLVDVTTDLSKSFSR